MNKIHGIHDETRRGHPFAFKPLFLGEVELPRMHSRFWAEDGQTAEYSLHPAVASEMLGLPVRRLS